MFKLLEPITVVMRDQKVVTYAGRNLIVHDWTRYIVTFENGDIFCYSVKPQLIPTLNHAVPDTAKVGHWKVITTTNYEIEFIATYTYEGDWKESLQEVD